MPLVLAASTSEASFVIECSYECSYEFSLGVVEISMTSVIRPQWLDRNCMTKSVSDNAGQKNDFCSQNSLG